MYYKKTNQLASNLFNTVLEISLSVRSKVWKYVIYYWMLSHQCIYNVYKIVDIIYATVSEQIIDSFKFCIYCACIYHSDWMEKDKCQCIMLYVIRRKNTLCLQRTSALSSGSSQSSKSSGSFGCRQNSRRKSNTKHRIPPKM